MRADPPDPSPYEGGWLWTPYQCTQGGGNPKLFYKNNHQNPLVKSLFDNSACLDILKF